MRKSITILVAIFAAVFALVAQSNPMGHPNKQMTILIKEINCWDTEDWGDDEVLLKMQIPPESGSTWQNVELRRKMSSKDNFNKGRPWVIDKKYRYNPANSLGGGCYPVLTLYDEDWPDPDDLLGEGTASDLTGGTRYFTFRTSSFWYKITYTLFEGYY